MSLVALAGAWGHRLGGDRTQRRRVRGRDQDAGVRRSPSRSSTGAGGMAVTPASAVVSTRRAASGLPGPRTRRPTARAQRSHGLDRSADPGAATRGRRARSACRRARHARTLRPPEASRLSGLHRQPSSPNARTGFPQYRAKQGRAPEPGDPGFRNLRGRDPRALHSLQAGYLRRPSLRRAHRWRRGARMWRRAGAGPRASGDPHCSCGHKRSAAS